jgi:hypothetical protein
MGQLNDLVAAQCAVTQQRGSDGRDLAARCPDQTTNSKAQAANFFLIDTEMHSIIKLSISATSPANLK